MEGQLYCCIRGASKSPWPETNGGRQRKI